MSEAELVPDEDWEEKYSDQHKRKYWKNKKTGKSSWTEPPKVPKKSSSSGGGDSTLASTSEATPSSDTELVPDEDWEEKYSDQHKRKFWKNKKTGKSSWTEPPKVPKKGSATTGVEAPTTTATAAESSSKSASVEEELVPDEDWEEKYSDQHKRKFWKNKKTGKSSWTEPPKVPKKANTETQSPTTAVDTQTLSATAVELVPDEDWEEKYSDQHKRKFWKNKKTGKSSWTEPPKVPKPQTTSASASEELVPDEDWEEKYSDQHKRKYWKNKKTGKSSWTEPPKVPKKSSSSGGGDSTLASTSEATPSSDTELVPDEDWEEKYSDQHKRKFWKNKKTGKSSWTEPPKVPKKGSATTGAEAPTTTATAAESSSKSASVEEELVPDEDWEEKYSDQHKKKFWKNKKTGKSSWTEPPKVLRAKQSSQSTTITSDTTRTTTEVKVEKPTIKEITPHCAILWTLIGDKWVSFPSKLICNDDIILLILYKEYAECTFTLSPFEMDILKEFAKKLDFVLQSDIIHSFYLLSNFTHLYCNELPGKLKFLQKISKSQENSQSDSLGHTTKESSEISKEISFMFSSKTEAFLWVKVLKTKTPKFEIIDSTESCLGDVDRVTMAALVTSGSEDRAKAEISWLQNLTRKLLSLPQQTQENLQVVSNLNLIEKKVTKLLEPVTDNILDRENILPHDGLVTVSMSSTNPLLSYDHDSYRGSLMYFNGQYYSLWIRLDITSHHIEFFDHGPTNEPCLIFTTSSMTCVRISNLAFEQNYLFEIQNCQDTSSDGNIANLTFSYSSSYEYWKWAISFANFLQIPSTSFSKRSSWTFEEKLSIPFSQSINSMESSSNWNQQLQWNNFMLDFTMDTINTITDRNMIRRFMKRYSIRGSDIRTIKFYVIHDRLIVSQAGSSSIRLGSVLITINNISAIGIPGRSMFDLIRELPSHAMIEVYCWEFPREIFTCNVLPIATTNHDEDHSIRNLNSYEEKKFNEEENKPVSSMWLIGVKVKLEGDSLIFTHRSTWNRTLQLANIRMRLIDVEEEIRQGKNFIQTSETLAALHVAVELRDKDSKILVSCSKLCHLLNFLCRVFEALKLFGTIQYDLSTFHDKCLQYQQHEQFLSESRSLLLSPMKGSLTTPMKRITTPTPTLTPVPVPVSGSGSALPSPLPSSTRSDIMKAAHELEIVFESLHITDSFPTVKIVCEILNSLQVHHIENHKLFMKLISLESEMAEESNTRFSFDEADAATDSDDKADNHSLDSFPIKSRAPFTFDSSLKLDIPHKASFNPLRRSLSQGHVRINSLMDTTSPHVFVPPADTKERKSSIVLANSRRASAISVTTSTPTAQSSIPILNEPGMQPLLPLIPSEKVSPEKPSEVVEQKEESEALVENQDDGKESKSPETLPVVVKAPASVVELSEKDLVYLSSIFFFLRDHPDIFLDLARCCDSLSELTELTRLYVTRIYAHWSSDESHLLRYLNEVISYHLLPPDSLDDCSRISIPEGEKRIRCLFPSFKSSELLPLIFDELCGRPDMIGFVKYISEGVGVNGRTLLSNGGHDNARLCSQIIEPICQRLDSVSSSGKVPVALRCMIISIVGQTHDDDRRRNDLLLLFANSFISRITRWLFNSNSQQSLSDDCMSIGEQAHLLETVQELLKLCFIKGSSSIDSHASPSRGQIPLPGSSESNSLHSRIIGSNFSLQTHAILSRSRWLISRFIEECSTPSTPPSNNQNPVRQMANFIGLKPFQCINCLSLSGRNIWHTLQQLNKVAETSISIWTSEIRELMSPIHHLIHESHFQQFWEINMKSSYLLQWKREDLFKENEKYSSSLSTSSGATSGTTTTSMPTNMNDYDHPGARELVSINWIINATRNVLKSLYEVQTEIPHDLTLLQELISLKESLENRRQYIQLCLHDLHSLQIFHELIRIYHSEIQLLVEMLSKESKPSNSHSHTPTHTQSHHHHYHHRTEEEYIFTLSKLCSRQYEIELKISHRWNYQQTSSLTNQQSHSHPNPYLKDEKNAATTTTPTTTPTTMRTQISSPFKSSHHLNLVSPQRRRSSSNSLQLLLQNVFPVESLQKKE